MLSIKLRRIGKAKTPSYRLIVVDRRKDPWGDYLEDLGFYNPRSSPATINFNDDRIKYWLSVGAQPSKTVHNFLVDRALILGPKVRVGRPKKKTKEEQTPAPQAAPSTPAPTS